jgi:hypothetical protein
MSSRKLNASVLALRAGVAIATIVLSFLIGASAHAGTPSKHMPRDSFYTQHFGNGYSISSRCHHSFYDGTTCSTSSTGNIFGSNEQPSAPVEDIEAPANWAVQCKSSCVDLSK